MKATDLGWMEVRTGGQVQSQCPYCSNLYARPTTHPCLGKSPANEGYVRVREVREAPPVDR